MVKINNHDFVEIHYTGKIKLLDRVFDTSDEQIAKSNNLFSKNMKYGPVIICIGEHNVIKGLDSRLENRETGKVYEIEVPAEEAFGKKDPKLMKVVSIALFKKQNMQPYPGLQINADGMLATVRSVNGGRVNIDFNHPLAGRDLVYTINVLKKVDDIHIQAKSLIKFNLLLPEDNFKSEIIEETLKITSKIPIPKPIQNHFEEKVKLLIPKIKKIEFLEEKTK